MRWTSWIALGVLVGGCRGECPPTEPRDGLVACSSKKECRVYSVCECPTRTPVWIATSAEQQDVVDAYSHCCRGQRCGLLLVTIGPEDEDLDCVDGRCVFPSSGSSWSVSSESE